MVTSLERSSSSDNDDQQNGGRRSNLLDKNQRHLTSYSPTKNQRHSPPMQQDQRTLPFSRGQSMIYSSYPLLQQDGHRVLIFSQMVRMLDILSDYMSLRGYLHQRLDRMVASEARKKSIAHFNTRLCVPTVDSCWRTWYQLGNSRHGNHL